MQSHVYSNSNQAIAETHIVGLYSQTHRWPHTAILSIGTLMVSRKDIEASIRECTHHLKSSLEVMPRGLSQLFGVGQQLTNRGKNNGVIVLTVLC